MHCRTETTPAQPQRNEALLQVFFLGVLPPTRPPNASSARRNAPPTNTTRCAN
jgi:hypothetical protein